jgi:hypothetical protein
MSVIPGAAHLRVHEILEQGKLLSSWGFSIRPLVAAAAKSSSREHSSSGKRIRKKKLGSMESRGAGGFRKLSCLAAAVGGRDGDGDGAGNRGMLLETGECF